MADEKPKYSKHVDGEHFESAEAAKEDNLAGPSEAELSEALVAKEHYVPPSELDPAVVISGEKPAKPRKAKKG